jgi:N-acetylglucosamine-6-phosphate deacetylase
VLLAAERILFPDSAEPEPGWLEIAGDRIVATGTGAAPAAAEVLDGLVVPGYVDVHCHGGGGASFVTEDPAEARRAVATHRRLGVTTTVASLVTGALPDLARQVACLAGLVEAGDLAGIHLEGPWLAPGQKGAHPPDLLGDPRPDAIRALLEAGRGTIRMVTIAPELPGAPAAIRLFADEGVLAAIGHTDADYDTCRAAIAAGARGATHLFNAMAPLRHREPGPVLALWEDHRVGLELILDGVHVRPELVAFVLATAPGRVLLVTDAMAAAGASDGHYVLGELAVEVRGGVARLAGTDTIAGSTLTLDRAVANAVAAGVAPAVAVRAATRVPADHLGLADVGRLAAGRRADLVVLDPDWQATRVLRAGEWQVVS